MLWHDDDRLQPMETWVLDKADAEPLLKRCLDLGITFFDTANWYSIGESERVVGPTLTSMVPRDQLVLATKAYYPMSDDPNDRGLSRKHLLSSVDASLKRLGTDYIDLFVIHAFDPGTPIEETMEALNDIVRSGKVQLPGRLDDVRLAVRANEPRCPAKCWTQFVNMLANTIFCTAKKNGK